MNSVGLAGAVLLGLVALGALMPKKTKGWLPLGGSEIAQVGIVFALIISVEQLWQLMGVG